MATYETVESVPFEWTSGDVFLDLYEVRPVTEGFRETIRVKPYHEGGFGRVYKVWHLGWQREMAVKRPRGNVFSTQEQKDVFTRECKTWIDLGMHPHLATCHYVRTLGGIPSIFSEYADAGTLEQWISSRRLYEGDEDKVLARVLDVAIQFAWGLHYAHERGVLHQDVKPMNALMWNDGTLKVADFGIAAARKQSDMTVIGDGQSILLSVGGMTPAYCSPEQAAGHRVNRRTDLWSWAVSMLEIFLGEVIWQSGRLAPETLQAVLDGTIEHDPIMRLPESVAGLLIDCLQHNPERRPNSLLECADRLACIYHGMLQHEYPRSNAEGLRDTAGILNNRALSLYDLGMTDEAQSLLSQAQSCDRLHLPSTYNLAHLRWLRGQCTGEDVATSIREIQHTRPTDSSIGDALHHVAALSTSCAGSEWRSFVGHSDAVTALAFSPNSSQLASGCRDGTLRLWDVGSGQCVAVVDGHAEAVSTVRYSPSGRLVVSGGLDYTLRMWRVDSSLTLFRTIEHAASICAIAVSGDGRLLAVGCVDGVVRVINADTSECVSALNVVDGRPTLVEFTPDARFLLCCAATNGSQSLRVYDIASGRMVSQHVAYDAHACPVFYEQYDSARNPHRFPAGNMRASAYCPDTDILVIGGSEGADCAYLQWGMPMKSAVGLKQLRPGGNYVECVDTCGDLVLEGVYADHPQYISIVGSAFVGRTLCRLWRASSGQLLHTFVVEEQSDPYHVKGFRVALSPDGRYAACSGEDGGTLRLWELTGIIDRHRHPMWMYAESRRTKDMLLHQSEYESLISRGNAAYDAHRTEEALSCAKGARSIADHERHPAVLDLQWRLAQVMQARCCLRGGWRVRAFEEVEFETMSLVCLPDSDLVVSGGADSLLRVWQRSSGKCLKELRGHTSEICSVTLLEGGQHVASASADTTVRLWDVSTGECLKVFRDHLERVNSVAYIPGRNQLLSGGGEAARDGKDFALRLWDISTGQCVQRFVAHEDMVFAVDVSPNARYAASGSRENLVHLWDIRTGRRINTLVGHRGVVKCVAISPDAAHVLTGSYDDTVRLWDLSSGKCLDVYEGHAGGVNSVMWLRGGKYALSSSDDGTVRLWDVSMGECVWVLEGMGGRMNTISVDRSGRYVVLGGWRLEMWELDCDIATQLEDKDPLDE